MYQTRIFNGVNHNVNLYENPENFTRNRKNQYFLTTPIARPDKVIRQMQPLIILTTMSLWFQTFMLILLDNLQEQTLNIWTDYTHLFLYTKMTLSFVTTHVWSVVSVSGKYGTLCTHNGMFWNTEPDDCQALLRLKSAWTSMLLSAHIVIPTQRLGLRN